MFKITNPAAAAIRYIYSAYVSVNARRSIRPLLKLDDRLLRDIGITRADVIDSLSRPIAEDPSDFLIDRRHSRIAARATVVNHPARWRGGQSAASAAPAKKAA